MTIEYYDGTKNNASNTSGWLCRLRSRFTDSSGGVWVVEIIDSEPNSPGFSWSKSSPEPFQLGRDGFSWKMDGKSDTFQVGAISTEVTFDLMVTNTKHDQILSVIKGSDDMRFGVAIYTVNGPVASGQGYTRPFWFGVISTEAINWGPYTHPDAIRIKAHCGLSLLNDVEFIQANGAPFVDTQNIGKQLQRIFSKIPTYNLWGWSTNGSYNQASSGTSGSSEGIVTMYQWIADKDLHLFGSSDTLEKSVIGYTRCDSEAFNEVEREEDIFGGDYVNTETISCAEVLKNILAVFQTRMFQFGGTFLAHCPWQTGSTTYVGRYQYPQLDNTNFTATEDTVTETPVHAAGFEMVAGVRDSFLFPVRQSKSTHKKGGARTIISRSGYTVNVTAADGNVYTNIISPSELINAAQATVEPATSISITGNLRIWSLGFGAYGEQYNIDTGLIGCKPVIQMTIKVGQYYLKRDLVMSSTGYNIHRTAAPDLTYKPMVQTGNVEWTTTPSTYDFQMPFPGCTEEPAVHGDDVVGGLHLALGNNDPFKVSSGFLGDGTQINECHADVAWTLPALPQQATDFVGVQFKATLKYMFRDGNNTISYGPESNGGLPGLTGHTPCTFTALKVFASTHDDPDADVVFTSANDTNYSTAMGCVSILGDRYTDQNMGVLFLEDVNNVGTVTPANQNWVTYGDTSAAGRPIHQLIARENLFMREETLRKRNVSFVGKVRSDHRAFNRVSHTYDSTNLISLLPPTRLVNIVDQATSTERKWYILNMAFTASSQTYDCELVQVDQSGGTTNPVDDDTRPFGADGEGTGGNGGFGGDSTNPSTGFVPVGLSGNSTSVATTSGNVLAIQSKTDLLTVTASTDLDTMRSDVASNNAKVGLTTDDTTKLGFINVNSGGTGVDSITGFTASGTGLTAEQQSKLASITVDGSGNVTDFQTNANAIAPASIAEDASNQFITTGQLQAISSNTSRITTAENDIDDLEVDLINVRNALRDTSGGGGRGVYHDDAKDVTKSFVAVTASGAKLQAGAHTGYDASETSPGTLDLNVAAGPSGSESAFTALRIEGSTTANRADLTIPQGLTIVGLNTSKISDITSAGSGAIITNSERSKLAGLPSSAISSVANDTTPQLGGDLDVNGNKIVSASNGNIVIDPAGTGAIILKSDDIRMEGAGTVTMSSLKFYEAPLLEGNFVGFKAPLSIASDVTWTLPGTDGTANQVLSTNGSGTLSFITVMPQANPSGVGTLVMSPVGALPAQIAIRDNGGTNQAILKVPSSLAGSYTLTLPPNDGDAGQFLTTDGSGTLSFAPIGWHGSSTLMKIFPTEFSGNDLSRSITQTFIEDDTSGTLGVSVNQSTGKMFSFNEIPTGYKATHVEVHMDSAVTNAVTVYQFNQTTGAITSVGTGNSNSNIDITDVTSSATASLCIQVSPGSTSRIVFGADVTIEKI